MTSNIDEKIDISSPEARLNKFGSRLSLLITFLNISQNEFARRIGASSAFISNIVQCKKRPGTDFLYKLAQCYGVSLDWLVTGNGSMFGLATINSNELVSIQMRLHLARLSILEKCEDATRLMMQLQSAGKTKKGSGTLSIETLIPNELEFTRTTTSSESRKREHPSQLFEKLARIEDETKVLVDLYNNHQWINDPAERLNQITATSLHYYQQQSKNCDPLVAILRKPS